MEAQHVISKPGVCKLTVSPVMPSPSARPPARSSTSVKKRRPSTMPRDTHHRFCAGWEDDNESKILTEHRLLAIKEKLKQQRQHMEDLDKHMSVNPSAPHWPGNDHI